jgi:hypothetical protein
LKRPQGRSAIRAETGSLSDLRTAIGAELDGRWGWLFPTLLSHYPSILKMLYLSFDSSIDGYQNPAMDAIDEAPNPESSGP